MARGTQHRKRRPPANARRSSRLPARRSGPSAPPTKSSSSSVGCASHAKWMFVFLAARLRRSTFIFLGVGSGSTGISQIVQNFFSGTSASGSSLSSLQKKTRRASEGRRGVARLREQAPGEEPARRRGHGAHDLHDARSRRTGRPAPARRHLPAARDRTGRRSTRLAAAHAGALADARCSTRSPTSKLGKALAHDHEPARERRHEPDDLARRSNEYSKVVDLPDASALDVYKKLAKLNPQDATTQLSLAQAASDAATRRPRSRRTRRS